MVLSDRVRGDAADTVRQLQDRGYRTIMLTGASLQGVVYTPGRSMPSVHLNVCARDYEQACTVRCIHASEPASRLR